MTTTNILSWFAYATSVYHVNYHEHLLNLFKVQQLNANDKSSSTEGVSNRSNGIWNGTMEWKREWNSEHTQLHVTRVTGAAQSRLNYLVYLQACYLTAEPLCASTALPTIMRLYPSMVLLLAHHHQMLCYCSLAKPDSRTKNKGLAS